MRRFLHVHFPSSHATLDVTSAKTHCDACVDIQNELRCEPTFDERQLFDEEEREGTIDELYLR
jgi:hypothetical protein